MTKLRKVGNKLCRDGAKIQTVECGCGPVDPIEPCTATGCPNGFVDSQGNPEPTPVVGCTFDQDNNPNTCLQVTFSMSATVALPYKFPPGGDPTVTATADFALSRSFCFGDDEQTFVTSQQVQCCNGQMLIRSDLIPSVFTGAPDNQRVFLLFEFNGGPNTQNGIFFGAAYQVWVGDDNQEPQFVFRSDSVAGILKQTAAIGVGITGTSSLDHDPVYRFNQNFNAFMVPVFRPGAGGVNQVVGAECEWLSTASELAFDGGDQFVLPQSFSGTMVVRLLNLRRYEEDCAEGSSALIDPRILDRLNRQANGGGCAGCGDGNNF